LVILSLNCAIVGAESAVRVAEFCEEMGLGNGQKSKENLRSSAAFTRGPQNGTMPV
jgi:hypothetical protein